LEKNYKNETAQIGAKTTQKGAKTPQISGRNQETTETTCFF
jgi:hypothetical protein